ncbi:MAG: bifunctional 4-hydroxy-2-oxoglutarate aldolase/2-dehydro-3-deoxy-phosphogluconate aldolase [Trueperaceae bacterium]
MDVVAAIETHRIVIVLRGLAPDACLRASRALLAGGISLFEVTMNSPRPTDAIRALVAELGERAWIGAGTVTSVDHVEAAAAAGARYVVSPDTNPAVIHRTRELGLVSVPGALTPTEVLAARDAGAHFVKVFPIRSVGADHLRQLRGPIDDVRFIATGGVTLEMIPELMEAGASAVAMGLHLLGADPFTTGEFAELTERAQLYREAVGAPLLVPGSGALP